MRETDAWCPRCLARVPEDETEERFAPPDAFIGPRLRIRHSRWAGNDVSYGPVGRILATILLVVFPLVYLFWTVAPFGLVYLVAACPLLLGAIWKKTAIHDTKD